MAVTDRLVEGKAALMQSKTVGERWLVTGARRRHQRWWWMDGAAVGVISNGDDGGRRGFVFFRRWRETGMWKE